MHCHTRRVELTDGIVLLRPLRPQDAADHHAGQDMEMVDAFEFPGFPPLEEVAAFIERTKVEWATEGGPRNWGVWTAEGWRLLGNVEVHWLDDGRLNLSYAIFPTWRRRGFAVRACRLALGYARDEMGATQATILVKEGNVASVCVAEALGAHRVGEETAKTGTTMVVLELDLAKG
jgi:RimJ/RimL family protein N-acetyltransferase